MLADDPANPSRRSFFLRAGAAPQPIVSLTAACFALRGVHCESCRDSCETGALRFVPQLGQPSRPVFDTARCNGCAECAKLCPGDAIQIFAKPEAAHA